MKFFKYIFMLLVVDNCIFAMNEVKRNSLVTFFDIEKFCDNKDITKNIGDHYRADKKWWYVDLEIASKKRNGSLWFNKRGTKIKSWSCEDDYIYKWDRADGKELGRILSDEDFIHPDTSDEEDVSSEASEEPIIIGGSNRDHIYHSTSGVEELVWLNNLHKIERVETTESKELMIAWHHNIFKVYVWDRVQKKEIASLVHKACICSVDFNEVCGKIITTSEDRVMHLWDIKTGKELLQTIFDIPVDLVVFNNQGIELAVSVGDHKIQIFAQYYPQQLSQKLLSELLLLWVQLEKPSKEINSPESLLQSVATLLSVDEKELLSVWESLPEKVQTFIWLSMHNKIQKYGK